MKEIKLIHQGLVAASRVDDEDYEKLSQYKWTLLPGRDGRTFYATTHINRHTIRMHREILGLPRGEPLVDHIDGNGLNNQRSNLRTCTNSQNQMNKIKSLNTASNYKGVSRRERSKNWRAGIVVSGIRKHLGVFTDELEAAIAYNEAARKYFGAFAKLNII